MKSKNQKRQEKRGAYERERKARFARMSHMNLLARRAAAVGAAKLGNRTAGVMPRQFKVETIGYSVPFYKRLALWVLSWFKRGYTHIVHKTS